MAGSGETSHKNAVSFKKPRIGGDKKYIKRSKYLTTSFIADFATAKKECLREGPRA
jgi:hypothetical protein